MSLVERLQQLQGKKTQAEFADELGISQSLLSQIYSGDRQIGTKVAKAIKRCYPELTDEVIAFLLADDITTIHTPPALITV